jgi:hypothetical protein
MLCDLHAIQAEIDRILRPIGLAWGPLEQRASQIILFGSRAANVAKDESDWDLLLVGDGKAVRTRHLDIIWVSPEMILSDLWLGSELASHVAAFGQWMIGPDEWCRNVHISAAAVERKRTGVEFQFEELSKVWPSLLPRAKTRHMTRLRRDIQRLMLLSAGEAIPPSHYLDNAWMKHRPPREDLLRLRLHSGYFREEAIELLEHESPA